MPANISDFRAIMFDYEGPSKLDRFNLRFPVPPCIRNAVSNDKVPLLQAGRFMEFFCNSADLPGMGLATRNIVRYGYGASEKKPVFPVFNDVWMQFLNDSGSINLTFFQTWLTSICQSQFYSTIEGSFIPIPAFQGQENRTDAYEVIYKEDYAVDAQLRLYDTHDEEQYVIVLRDFFPVLIPETKLSWDNVNSVFQLVVMFSYTDWFLMKPKQDEQNQPPPPMREFPIK
jgi:hypothetical protein